MPKPPICTTKVQLTKISNFGQEIPIESRIVNLKHEISDVGSSRFQRTNKYKKIQVASKSATN